MSPETVETEIALLKQNDSNICKSIENIESLMEKMSNKQDDYHKESEKKYARKSSVDKIWAIIWAIIGVVFLGIGGALLSLILK